MNILFLVIGLIGGTERMRAERILSPLEEPVMESVELTPTVPPESPPEAAEEQEPQDTRDAADVVAVVLDSPEVKFSVPTVGTVLVKAGAAQAPPARPLAVAPKAEAPPIVSLQWTDVEGGRPPPTFPPEMMRRGMRGTVVVRINVDAQGRKQDVTIQETSGYRELDDHVRLWILKHWIRFPDGVGERQYKCALTFKIN